MDKDKAAFGDLLQKFLEDMKADIEKDGMIATLDEAILRVDKWLNN